MNHVKYIFNVNVQRRISSNTGITQCGNTGNEKSFKKRAAKSRSGTIDNSFMLAVRKVYPFLIKHRREETRIVDNDRAEMLCGKQANPIRRLLSERKLPLQYVDGLGVKQTVRFGSSSSLSYDRTINYEDDGESRSYAQMITAYNETLTSSMIEDESNVLRDPSSSKTNVQLSRTHFKATSTLSSSAYNFDNFTIKENTAETSMTDLAYAIDATIRNDASDSEKFSKSSEKKEKCETCESTVVSKAKGRSYASIIAEYSAAMDVNSILNKYKKDVSKPSASLSSVKGTTTEKPKTEGGTVSEFASSPDLSTGMPKRAITEEESNWLKKVDKILNDLKNATAKATPPSKQTEKKTFGLREKDILECVTKQAVWTDKSTITQKRRANVTTPRKRDAPKDDKEETETVDRTIRAERSDKSFHFQASSSKTHSTSLDSSTGKDWSQVPKGTRGLSTDPQVELRMIPSGNESIVAVNVEAVAKALESRSSDSKELSVTVFNNKDRTKTKREEPSTVLATSAAEANSSYGSMRISISEGSLPVKELELSINGKPINDVRTIKARTETLDVTTSLDKVEIRVPYQQDDSSRTTNSSTKNFTKNVQAESVLKLRIATAFDGTQPNLTTGSTRNVQSRSNVQSDISKSSHLHTGGTGPKKSEMVPSTKSLDRQESSASTVKRSDKPVYVSSKTALLHNPTTSTTFGGGDFSKTEKSSDIDLRLTKMFGTPPKIKAAESSAKMNLVKSPKEPSKGTNVKSAPEKRAGSTLTELLAKHAVRSNEGGSSGSSGKPQGSSDEKFDGSKPRTTGNKRETSTTDDAKRKSMVGDLSLKSDPLDERIKPKWTPWWSATDAYTKIKKEEDSHKDFSTPVDVTEKEKEKKIDSRGEASARTAEELFRASLEEKTLSAKSQDSSKSKVIAEEEEEEERKGSRQKNETVERKEPWSASSDARDAEETLESSWPSKNENVRITRRDSSRVNEERDRHSFSVREKIDEEKLNQRNEGSLMKETRKNASTPSGESPAIDVISKSADARFQEDIMDLDSKEKLSSDDSWIERSTRPNPARPSSEIKLNMRPDVRTEDSKNEATKQAKPKNKLSDEDEKIKEILNSMKPIEKKKDGTLIDYGIKVPSRKKPERLKSRAILGTSDAFKRKAEKKKIDPTVSTFSESKREEQRLSRDDDVKTEQAVQSIDLNPQKPVEYAKNVNFKEDTKKETASAENTNFKEDKRSMQTVNLSRKENDFKPVKPKVEETRDESLNDRITKILEKLKEQIPYQTTSSPEYPPKSILKKELFIVNKEPRNVKENDTATKSAKQEQVLKDTKSNELVAKDESLNDSATKTSERSKDSGSPALNVAEESPKKFLSFTEESTNVEIVKTDQKSNEDKKEPPIILKPSTKPSTLSTGDDASTKESLGKTIVPRSSKELNKKQPKGASPEPTANVVESPAVVMDKPKTPPTLGLSETTKTETREDSAGTRNPGSGSGSVTACAMDTHLTSKSSTRVPISVERHSTDSSKLFCKGTIKRIGKSSRPKRAEKELVYSVWLRRSTDDDKKQ